ncbi:unnamed protein product [Mycetohabitans rhizoxinica HKI 454]|uniref:Uncharacterized protein n=1 Tax=Mycetohabitans rhizoxinica (strain DSM 19002 / CIP 109453 / HKI 454) TaxID=882378 RepID=E5AMM6_MYCRK|nr:unnamed protein product [Mycetohabitans rhizoxinica HKI 454]
MTRATESIAGFRHVSGHVADTAMGRCDIEILPHWVVTGRRCCCCMVIPRRT